MTPSIRFAIGFALGVSVAGCAQHGKSLRSGELFSTEPVVVTAAPDECAQARRESLASGTSTRVICGNRLDYGMPPGHGAPLGVPETLLRAGPGR